MRQRLKSGIFLVLAPSIDNFSSLCPAVLEVLEFDVMLNRIGNRG